MVTSVLDRPIVPIAEPDDAIATYDEFRPYFLETDIVPLRVHVIETARGEPDKIRVQQCEEYDEEARDVFRKRAQTDGLEVDTELLYGSDVPATIHDAADEFDASVIVFLSRGGRRWLQLATGHVRANIIAASDHMVVIVPNARSNHEQ